MAKLHGEFMGLTSLKVFLLLQLSCLFMGDKNLPWKLENHSRFLLVHDSFSHDLAGDGDYTCDELVEYLGMGTYQKLWIVLFGFSSMAQASEVMCFFSNVKSPIINFKVLLIHFANADNLKTLTR